MKKAIAILIILAALFTLFSCKGNGNGGDTQGLSQREEYQQKRNAFINSELHTKAVEYFTEVLEDLVPGCSADLSLEPGDLIDSDLSEFSDFDGNDDTKRDFFSKADLSFVVDFWNFDIEAEDFAKQLMDRGISGRMTAGEAAGGDCYELDAISGTAKFVPEPGV